MGMLGLHHSPQTRALMGRSTKARLQRNGWVENAPIREAVLSAVQNGTNYHRIACQIEGDPRRGDTTRLKRRLGLVPESKKGTISTLVRYDIAVAICRAIDRDPVDLGL